MLRGAKDDSSPTLSIISQGPEGPRRGIDCGRLSRDNRAVASYDMVKVAAPRDALAARSRANPLPVLPQQHRFAEERKPSAAENARITGHA